MSAATLGYVSTRALDAEPVTFEHAMLAGLAPDGGLYMPTALPPADPAWRVAGSPAAVAAAVLPELLGLDESETYDLFAQALDFAIPVVELPGARFVLELFHGPTAAFKDIGARSMARLMDRALARSGTTATVIVATSGDTGGAVAAAFAGLANVRVAVLYPAGRVSEVQERQLTVRRPGVTAFAVAGSFDDCQRLVKGAFADPELAGIGLSTANSINVARLLPQSVYYFWAAKQVADQVGSAEPLTVVVPSGNLGNLTAAVLATRMGAPLRALVAAHNSNDYFVRYVAGTAPAYDFDPSVATLSNAMDVGAPSNFERLHSLLAGGQGPSIAAGAVDDDATITRMRLSALRDGYLPCPHTAVALDVAERLRDGGISGAAEVVEGEPVLVLATAHPAKFPDAVRRASGTQPPPHAGLDALADAQRSVVSLAADQGALRDGLLALHAAAD